jgi:hypothetical protein
MVKIQYVSTYINLSLEGLVPKLLCPQDQGLLFCNGDGESEVYLYCLECKYKNTLGLQKYDDIVKLVNEQTK